MVFDARNRRHPEFVAVFNWVNGKGGMIYGGTKYAEELAKTPRYLAIIAELARRRRAVRVPTEVVDSIARELKARVPEPEFNDEHIAALVIASKCRVVCTDDNSAISYLKRRDVFAGYNGAVRPKIYRGKRANLHLCCDDNITGLFREHCA